MTLLAGAFGLVMTPLVRAVVTTVTGRRSSRSTALWTVLVAVATVTALNHGGHLAARPGSVAVFLGLAALGVALAHIDVSTRRLPDVLVLSVYPLVAAVMITDAIATGDSTPLTRGALAAGLCLAGHAAVATTGATGGGDAKLAGLLGLALGWLSWSAVAAATVLALCFAAIPALMALVRHGRRATIAFGPPLLLGALAGLAVG